MRLPKLYINGYLIDLAPSTVIASTFQAVNIGDPTSRKANYTNRLKASLSPNNIKAFGFVNSIESTSTIPWTQLDAKIVDGPEIMQNATALVRGAGDGFDIEVYSGNFDFYSKLGEKTLEDLTGFNTAVDDTYIGVTPGMFDKNYINTVTGVNEAANPLPDARQVALKYDKIINKIITSAGYTPSGNVFALSKLSSLRIFPVGDRGYYNSTFTKSKEFIAQNTTGAGTIPAAWTVIDFPTLVQGSAYWNNLNQFTALRPVAGYTNTWFTHQFFFRLTVTNICTMQVRLRNVTTGATIALGTTGVGAPPLTTYFNSGPVNCKDNEVWQYEWQTGLGVPNAITFTDFSLYNKVSNVNPATDYFNAQGLMDPALKQKDVFKNFCVNFGVLIDEQSQPGVLICKQINEVIKDKANAKDWTTKYQPPPKGTHDPINFIAESVYGQNSYFKYPIDDEYATENLGRGSMQISNPNLDPSKDIYESVFYASLSTYFGNSSAGFLTTAKVPWTIGSDTKVRLLYSRASNSYDPTLAGGVVGGSADYRVAYFVDPIAVDDCNFQKFIDAYYTELKLSLQNARTVTRKYKLTQSDIAGLNLLVPVYDKGSYFLINKISNYVPDKVTSVELFKII